MPLMKDFIGHECAHVISLGWQGTYNGELLTKAEQAAFDVLVTFDANIPIDNDVTARAIAVYIVQPEGQGIQATRALMGELLVALQSCTHGQVATFSNRTRKRLT